MRYAENMARHGNLRTWIEVSRKAALANARTFRSLADPAAKIFAVVKSNAYGHGLWTFADLVKDQVDGFCVDSAVEGFTLREKGITKPILILGPTLPANFREAAEKGVAISISNFDALEALAKFSLIAVKKTKNENKNSFDSKLFERDILRTVDKKSTVAGGASFVNARVPEFHIKIDTGMHRQGFYLEDVPKVIKFLKSKTYNLKPTGLFTHFAAAKDINYPTYTEGQFEKFQTAAALFEQAGFKNLIKHAAATGGALIDKKYHLDAVRVGIGMYGLWPSRELEAQIPDPALEPVLSWRTVVAETKKLEPGDFVGYDLSERVRAPMRAAVLPVGYWHGFPRALSGTGEVLINGMRAKVLGRVSMDMIVVGAPDLKCKAGDTATLIGRDGAEEISAYELAEKMGASHYELVTRLNPLMERIITA